MGADMNTWWAAAYGFRLSRSLFATVFPGVLKARDCRQDVYYETAAGGDLAGACRPNKLLEGPRPRTDLRGDPQADRDCSHPTAGVLRKPALAVESARWPGGGGASGFQVRPGAKHPLDV